MPTVAAVWGATPAGRTRSAADRRALDDQGPYAAGTPFDAFVVDPADLAALGTTVWAWRVEERVPRAGPADCQVAMVSLMRRAPGTTHAEFVAHWTERHAPLALRRHIGLADYRQLVVVDTLTPATPEIDGIALLGFRSRTDFETRFFDSDEGRAEIMADVARFMDRPGPETTLVEPSSGHG